MRRLYVMPLDVYKQHAGNMTRGSHWLGLYDPSTPNAVAGWQAAGSPVLVNCEFSNEYHEDRFHEHPDVAVLPSPQFEPTDQLKKHVGSQPKKFKAKHAQHLAAIGVADTDTIWDVSTKAARHNPNMKIRGYI